MTCSKSEPTMPTLKGRRQLISLGLLSLWVAASGSIPLAAATGQDGMVSALKIKYPITQTSPDHTQIAQQGIVMHIVKNGINARPWDSLMSFDNLIVDGAVQQRSRWIGFTQTTEARLGQGKNLLILQPGNKVFISKIESRSESKDDLLNVSILSCDPLPVDDGASQKRYVATLSFKMPKNSLAESAPDQIEQMVETMLAPDSMDAGDNKNPVASAAPAKPRPAAQTAPAKPATQAATALAAPSLAAAAAVVPGGAMVKSLFSLGSVLHTKSPAAPPATQPTPATQAAPAQSAPAPPVPTQTISLGQTIEQIVAAMGQPKQLVDLGAKKIYTYPNLKIVFVNGKVTEVQ